MNSLSRINIVQVLLFAITIRIIWACFVAVDPVSDSVVYDAFAQSIANGTGFAFPDGSHTSFWPVGTSAVYALLYSIFGYSYIPIVIFNLIIGIANVWLTYAIAQRYLNQKIAVLAAAIVAIWPILIQFTTILASELLFIFLLLAAIFVWGSKSIPPVIRAVVWGSLICAATYVRPTALPLIVILPVLDWFANSNWRQCLSSLVIAALSAAVLFSPWVYRNYQVFGQFVLVSANGGSNVWMGNHHGSDGGYTPLPNTGLTNEAERDQYLKQEAIKFITNHPVEYMKLAVKRAIITYKAETIGIVWNGALHKTLNQNAVFAFKLGSTIFWWLVLILATIGLYQILRKGELSIFNVLLVTFAFFFIFPLLTVGQDRYHLPLNPFLAIFAAYALHHIGLNKQPTMTD